DDAAYAVLLPRKKQRVLLVTPGNLFLEGALLLEEGVEVERVAPAAYAPERAANSDVVLYDRFAPAAAPRAPAVLYIAPPSPQSPFAVVGTVRRPLLAELAESHPLMRYVSLVDVNVTQAQVFRLERGDVALASALHQPIIVAGLRAGGKRIALGFDVRQS